MNTFDTLILPITFHDLGENTKFIDLKSYSLVDRKLYRLCISTTAIPLRLISGMGVGVETVSIKHTICTIGP